MTAHPDLNSSIRIERDDFGDVAAEVFARSFVDDPFVKECLRLEDDQLPAFFDPLVSLAHLCAPTAASFVLYEQETPAAAATLLPPDWNPELELMDAALQEMRQSLGFLAMTRVYRMLHATSKLPIPPERSTHLLFLGTHPGHRRKGYGSKLLEHLDAETRDCGAACVYLEVVVESPARWLYEGDGYEEIGRSRILGHEIAVLRKWMEE